MAKRVKSRPLMISIAEKLGTTVGRIVATTTGAVEEATRMVEGAAKSLKSQKAVRTRKAKRVVKRKVGTIRKKAVRSAVATTRKRKRPAEN
jgi:hypothetical protein